MRARFVIKLDPAPVVFDENAPTEWVKFENAIGRICANNCGLFPPCTPLILRGEEIREEQIALMKNADNVFGVRGDEILVLTNEGRE